MKMVIAENAALLTAARDIFGDIVAKAYIASIDLGSIENNRKAIMACESHIQHSPGLLECDPGEIVLELINGKRISIGASEWASISDVDRSTDAYEEIKTT